MNDDFVSDSTTDMDIFDIGEYKIAPKEYVKPFLPFSITLYKQEKKYFHYLFYKLRRYFSPYKLILEQSPSAFQPIFERIDVSKNYYFMGHWMNLRYFVDYENQIRSLFKLKDSSFLCSDIAHLIQNDDKFTSVSLHIRRGDYLNSGFIETMDIDYYKKAIEYIKLKVSNPYLFIFTNDFDWVEKHFQLDIPLTFVKGNTRQNSYKDMVLMSLCKHNIIANSSFSWWGAWLNENPDKCVIAPKKWYADEKRNKFASEITPKEWIRL